MGAEVVRNGLGRTYYEEMVNEGNYKNERVVSRAAGNVFAVFAGVALLVVAVAASFHFFIAAPVADSGVRMIDRFAVAVSGVFGEEVTVRGSTAVLEKSEIGEFALVQRKIQVITKYETSWLGSEKLIIVRGDFIVKAGVDLSAGGQWEILEGKINGPLPTGEVLSVEPLGAMEVYYSENGLINLLTPEDQARAFNLMIRQARIDAERSDIAREAEQVLIRRVRDRMGLPVPDDLGWRAL